MANCPKCGFAGASILHDGARKCAKCGEIYRTGVQYPPPPMHGQASTAGNATAGRAVLIGIVVFVLISGVVAFILIADSEPAHHTDDSATTPATVGTTDTESSGEPANGRIDATVTPVLKGMNGQAPWWLLKYRNTGEVTISRPAVSGTFRANGQRVKTQRFMASVYSLGPGQEIWLRVVPGLTGETEAAFTVDSLEKATSYTSIYRPLEIVSHESQKTSGRYSTISGSVRNQTKDKAASVHVFAVGYDSRGVLCAFVDGYVSGSGIAAGGQGEFKLYAGTWQTDVPERWELTAWGRKTK